MPLPVGAEESGSRTYLRDRSLRDLSDKTSKQRPGVRETHEKEGICEECVHEYRPTDPAACTLSQIYYLRDN